VITDQVMGMGVAADGTTLVAGWSEERWVKALDPSGALQWTWINDVAPGTSSLAVFPDGGFAMGDGIFLDPEDPDACDDGLGECPAVMRVVRVLPDRTPAWGLETSECNVALVVTPTADGGLLTLAHCDVEGAPLGMGLFQFEP
jgi:hypothetical protein